MAVLLIIPLFASALNVDNVNVTTGPGGKINAVFTVTNNDNVNYTNLSVSVDDIAKYNLVVNSNKLDINNGTTKTVTVTGQVPTDENFDVVKTTNLHITGKATAEGILNINVTSMIEFRDVQVESNDHKETVKEGDDFNRVKVGEELTISGDVYNLFTKSDSIKIEDVEVDLTIYNIDDGDDYEDSADLGDISPTRHEGFDFSYDVPYDLKDKETYDVDLHVSGEDDNGNTHEKTMSFTITIDRDMNKLKITRVEFNPSTVSCSRNTEIDMRVMNYGSNDQKKVTYQVVSQNSAITYNQILREVKLDSNPSKDDNEVTKIFPLTIPKTLPAGDYKFKAIVYYNDDHEADETYFTLKVVDCPTSTTTTTSTTTSTTASSTTTSTFVTTTTYIPPTQEQTNGGESNGETNQQGTVTEFKNVSSSNDTLIIVLLVTGIVIGVILIVVLTALILKK